MKYSTIITMPDSKQKFLKLEKKLLQIRHHGDDFFIALNEYNRLFNVYRKGGKA